jgi:NAD(P)-dependent dehydrogenase (short-subunit alcohol dehydrogenase family)
MTDEGDPLSQLHDRYAIVTGGTQGLGEATARLFAARGAAGLVICGRKAERGREVAESISATGCPTTFVQADLAKVDDCFNVVDVAERRFDAIHVLVNCAGRSDRGTVTDTTPDGWDRMFAVNARAPFFLLQRAVQVMVPRGIAGTIVNVVTMASHGGPPYLVPYSASKGALATLTRSTACALLRHRIRVNGLNIGWANTPGEHETQKRWHDAPDDWLDRAATTQPFGRLIEPAEVARAIAFLATDESGLMTGAVVDFDQNVLGTYDWRSATA